MRFKAWIWDFSSTQRTIAFSGGSRYNPTMSATFGDEFGVGGECEGLHPPGSDTVLAPDPGHGAPIPKCVARMRESQSLTTYYFGGGANVTAISSRRSSVLGRPERSSSKSPATPSAS